MIIAVSGWRFNKALPHDVWETLLLRALRGFEQRQLFVRFGDCPTGTDADFWSFVQAAQLPHHRFLAEWDVHDKAAGPLRNRAMLRGNCPLDVHRGLQVELLLAFPEPGPRKPRSGTWDCVDTARELDIEVHFPSTGKLW